MAKLSIPLLNSLATIEIEAPSHLTRERPLNEYVESLARDGFWRETREGRVFHPGHMIAAIRMAPPSTRKRPVPAEGR